jgi:hypothetical protein
MMKQATAESRQCHGSAQALSAQVAKQVCTGHIESYLREDLRKEKVTIHDEANPY